MWRCSFLLILTLAAVSYPQTPEALVQDAISKQRAGDLEGAVKEYREFLKIQPEAAVIRSNLGLRSPVSVVSKKRSPNIRLP